MPWGDWQFWVVSLAAGWGLWAVLRQLLPRRGAGEAPCASCAVGTAVREARQRGGTSVSGSDQEPS
jgi:hypothetical protein